MWSYTDKTKDYFFNPRNAGALADANAVGEVGAASTGDALRLMLKVDPQTEIIEAASFLTYGCGSAIASSSALTELVVGRTLADALTISDADISDYLGGLPPEKLHCSVLGSAALRAAVADYRQETLVDDRPDPVLVCRCNGVDEATIERAIRLNAFTTIEQVMESTGAGSGCLSCADAIEDLLMWVNSELVEQGVLAPEDAYGAEPFDAQLLNPANAAKAKKRKRKAERAKAPANLSEAERYELISQTIENLRPFLRKDGGDCELVGVEGLSVYLKLSGACVGCQQASLTTAGIQEELIDRLGVPMRVIPIDKTWTIGPDGKYEKPVEKPKAFAIPLTVISR